MSADNAIVVWETNDGWNVDMVFMSPFDEDCKYLENRQAREVFDSRGKALEYAHDWCSTEYIVEYGVLESGIPKEFCGSCWVCINERGIISPDVDRCDNCNVPLITWKVMNAEGTFCRSCERR